MTTPLDALSRQQRTFVLGFMQSGNAYQAALNAGYSDLVAAQAGDILLRNDLVKKALRALRATHRESVRQQVMLATTDAIGVMMDVMRDPVMPPNARIQAAKEIMAVSGVAPPKEATEDTATDDVLDALPPAKVSLALAEAKK